MKSTEVKLLVAIIFSVVIAGASVALAGDVDVRGGSSTNILDVQNTSTDQVERIAVYGKSVPAAGWGVGGIFEGGDMGVKGMSTISGSGTRIGVEGYAASGSTFNIGVYGYANGGTAYAGYFQGNVYTTGQYLPSDENLKDEINDLDGSLDQVMELKPKIYRYRTKENPNMNLPEGYHMGLLAQELAQVMPDLVTEVPIPDNTIDKDSNGVRKPQTFLAANYIELIPVLIKAIQEQQQQMENLEAEVANCGCR